MTHETETRWILRYTDEKGGYYDSQDGSGSIHYHEPRTQNLEDASRYDEYSILDEAIDMDDNLELIQIKIVTTYQEEPLSSEIKQKIKDKLAIKEKYAKKYKEEREVKEREEYKRLKEKFND